MKREEKRQKHRRHVSDFVDDSGVHQPPLEMRPACLKRLSGNSE